MSQGFNLVIFHTPRLQDINDFQAIRLDLLRTHPEITTSIISTPLGPDQLRAVQSSESGAMVISLHAAAGSPGWASLAKLPTLLFSPVPLRLPPTVRGFRLFAQHATKLQEMEILRRKGFPVPRSALLTSELVLDEGTWGSKVVVKPIAGRGGDAVQLLNTCDVRAFLQRRLDEGQRQPLMVQQWIDTGPYISCFRAMTVLDRVVFVLRVEAFDPLVVTEDAVPEIGLDVASQSRRRKLLHSDDQDVFRLAADIAQNVTFSCTFGIDFVREHSSGKLFVLELNSGFPSWHLSSALAKKLERTIGTFTLADRYRQYDALKNIGDALARATKLLAR